MAYCDWDATSEKNQRYHDEEWGVPNFDDRHHFEHLMLEVLQCGLSWDLIIQKRDIIKQCFHDFNYEKIAQYTKRDIDRIMATPGMIKSPRKINAIISNAKTFIAFQKEHGGFAKFLWSFTDNKIILYDKHSDGYIPASNGLSAKIANELKKAGFKYVGPITIYSHMQSVGIINDHDRDCKRRKEILSEYETIDKERDNEVNVVYYR